MVGLCTTVNLLAPANIISTNITVNPTSCISPCDVTVNVTWENTGDITGTFNPSININDEPISPAQYSPEQLDGGQIVTHSFSLSGLVAGTYSMCVSPDSGTNCQTITVTTPPPPPPGGGGGTPANIVSTALTVDNNACILISAGNTCNITGSISWQNTGQTNSDPTDLGILINDAITILAPAIVINAGQTITYPFTITLSRGTYSICASPNSGTECQIINIYNPANIMATYISAIPDVAPCTEPCNLTVAVTWENIGDVTGVFTPSINIDSTPISPAQYIPESLAANSSITRTFTVTGVVAGLHEICPDPDTGVTCATITVEKAPIIDIKKVVVVAAVTGVTAGAIYFTLISPPPEL